MPADTKTLGRYQISRKLGEGGMGVVYEAADTFLGRKVALKVAKPAAGKPGHDQRHQVERFLKEARLAAQFIHPNIVITYDAGFDKDRFFMALEFIDGKGLDRHVRPDRLLPRLTVMEIIYNICFALEYIHEKGYIHLDLKPSNIMMSRMGEIKLMDFGIARFLKDKTDPAAPLAGSPYYMSPEQVESITGLDRRSDVFSMGVVFYELLTGQRPFTGETPYQIIYQISQITPPSLESHAPDIAPDLAGIVRKALEKDREKRFGSTREMAEALLPLIKGHDSSAVAKEDRKKIALLRRLPFFLHFQYGELSRVLKLSSWRLFPMGGWIAGESRSDSLIYFLIQGTAELHLAGEVKKFRAGDSFGESAILFQMPRQARVKAKTECLVMTLNANLLTQADDALQVKFLREFYRNKILQLVEANLRLIQTGPLSQTISSRSASSLLIPGE